MEGILIASLDYRYTQVGFDSIPVQVCYADELEHRRTINLHKPFHSYTVSMKQYECEMNLELPTSDKITNHDIGHSPSLKSLKLNKNVRIWVGFLEM